MTLLWLHIALVEKQLSKARSKARHFSVCQVMRANMCWSWWQAGLCSCLACLCWVCGNLSGVILFASSLSHQHTALCLKVFGSPGAPPFVWLARA